MKLGFLSLILFSLHSVHSLNILGIFPHPGKSHFIVYRILLRELASRGHNVTVISNFPEKDSPKNYHDLNLEGNADILENLPPMERTYRNLLESMLYLLIFGKQSCEDMLVNSQVQNVIRHKQKFDVVVVEQFNSDCALGVAYKLKAPVVGITSNSIMPWHYRRLGIPYNPSYVSFLFSEGGTRPSLFQRIERVVLDTTFKALYHFVGQSNDQNTLAKYFDDIPPLEDLAREIKFLLVYNNFVYTGSKLLPANVIEVGGYHVAKAKPLTGDLKKFVDDAEHGVVYISFGSLIKAASLPKEKVEIILSAINEFPQKFIWKWENDTIESEKTKLFVSNWLPQVDILGHSKTLAFFSHAGMGSTTEAVHFGVPMIVMPILGDQPSNAAAIEEIGFGVQILQYKDLTKDDLVAALKTVLDPGFRENAKKISSAWHDRPMPPLDTAVFWTEFAARHSNFTFRTAAADILMYQYINLDIIGIFLVVIISIASLLFLVCKKSKKIEKVQKNKKN